MKQVFLFVCWFVFVLLSLPLPLPAVFVVCLLHFFLSLSLSLGVCVCVCVCVCVFSFCLHKNGVTSWLCSGHRHGQEVWVLIRGSLWSRHCPEFKSQTPSWCLCPCEFITKEKDRDHVMHVCVFDSICIEFNHSQLRLLHLPFLSALSLCVFSPMFILSLSICLCFLPAIVFLFVFVL